MNNENPLDETSLEKKRFWLSIYVSFIITSILGLIKFSSWAFGYNEEVIQLGILPLHLSGLKGILFAPLIHADAEHYFGNAITLFVLSTLIFYFYKGFYFKLLLIVWLFDGIGVWLIGREVYHVGASGVIYGLASFAFFSGVLKKNRNMLAMSLLVLFLYGSMIWGLYPLENGISWEAHLAGFLTGTFIAVYYKNSGPHNDVVPDWMNEPDEEQLVNEPEIEKTEIKNEIVVKYEIKK